MVIEGQNVKYVGDDPYIGVGTLGRVLSISGQGLHTMWSQGSRYGQVDLVSADEVVPDRSIAAIQPLSSPETPALPVVAVRDTYDDGGEQRLLSCLDEAGHIAALSDYAEEALAFVGSRIRTDPNFAVVLSELDESEADSFVARVAGTLLADMVIEGMDD